MFHRSQRSQSGATLLELLVVFLIIGASGAIFVPLIQQVREHARITECQAKLRRVARGILNFEAAQGALPAAAYLNDVEIRLGNCPDFGTEGSTFGTQSMFNGCIDFLGRKGGPNFSWIVTLLPYLERQDLYDQVDFSIRAHDHFSLDDPTQPQHWDDQPVFAHDLPQLICPADAGPKAHYNGTGILGWRPAGSSFAKTNYAAFTSVVHVDHFVDRQGALGGFEPGSRAGQRLSRVVDGASNTMMISEIRRIDRSWDARGSWAVAFPGSTVIAVDYHSADRNNPDYFPLAEYDIDNIALPNTQTYADVGPTPSDPGSRLYLEALGAPGQSWSSGAGFLGATARSLHPFGVNAAALDGRVGFVTDRIDPLVYTYLIYTRDGQVTDFADITGSEAAADPDA